MDRDRPHVVVVGAGFAGLEVARALGRSKARVTVIDRRNFHLFVPLLYQVATAALSPAEVIAPIRSVLRRYANIEVLLGNVTGVDPARRLVLMGESEVGYDILVIATGSGQSYFGNDDWAAHAPGLKTIEDAREIRGSLLMAFERAEMTRDEAERRRLMTFVVVGGGPTGVEMAGSIAELARETLKRDFRHIRPDHARIVLLEAADRLLLPFPEGLARFAHNKLERLGVEVRTECMVEEVGDRGVVAGGERIPAATIVWGAGVQASPAANWLGIEPGKGGTVPVDRNLRVEGLDDVYVLGDTALCPGEDGGPLPQLAQVAKQQGQYLGRALRRTIEGGSWPGPFRYRNYGNMATVGRNAAVADFGWWQTAGFLAWLLWGVVHVFLLVGFRNRVTVTLQWLWIYLTYQRGARLITGEHKAPIVEEPGQG
ncbi:MAG: NAD(P)/FAD-dependent oxidoreductase [Geminicoccaceae bacterium]|nr:NAD(P)/FAD-dependent oxidoreductase [Geminicoccaceae bacterium]